MQIPFKCINSSHKCQYNCNYAENHAYSKTVSAFQADKLGIFGVADRIADFLGGIKLLLFF